MRSKSFAEIGVQVNSNTAYGTAITNTASVGPIDNDPNPGNNATSFTTSVTAEPTTISISAPTVTYGSNAVVTVTVKSSAGILTGNVSLTVNNGPPITQALGSDGQCTFTL